MLFWNGVAGAPTPAFLLVTLTVAPGLMEYDDGLLPVGLGLVEARTDIRGLNEEKEDALSAFVLRGTVGRRSGRVRGLNAENEDDLDVWVVAGSLGGRARGAWTLGLKEEVEDGLKGFVLAGLGGVLVGRD